MLVFFFWWINFCLYGLDKIQACGQTTSLWCGWVIYGLENKNKRIIKKKKKRINLYIYAPLNKSDQKKKKKHAVIFDFREYLIKGSRRRTTRDEPTCRPFVIFIHDQFFFFFLLVSFSFAELTVNKFLEPLDEILPWLAQMIVRIFLGIWAVTNQHA